MKDEIWYNLVNIKFKAFYTCICGQKADLYDRMISIILAVFSSASVAGWVFWAQHKTIWAIVIGSSQLMAIARPFVPFLKNESKFMSVSFEFEALYLKYLILWRAVKRNPGDTTLESALDELRAKQLEIEKHSPNCPTVDRWLKEATLLQNRALSIDFAKKRSVRHIKVQESA